MSNRNSSNSVSNNAQANKQEFFNLHTKGCGYLSRVRWVTTSSRGRRSEPFLCCAINALHGSADDPSYSYFDLRVSGADAQQLIASLEQEVNARKRVFIAFVIGDIYAHPYERNIKDEKSGQITGKEWAALIKGRLLNITHVKVDGQTIYAAEGNTSAAEQSSEQSDDGFNDGDAQDADFTEYDQRTGTY